MRVLVRCGAKRDHKFISVRLASSWPTTRILLQKQTDRIQATQNSPVSVQDGQRAAWPGMGHFLKHETSDAKEAPSGGWGAIKCLDPEPIRSAWLNWLQQKGSAAKINVGEVYPWDEGWVKRRGEGVERVARFDLPDGGVNQLADGLRRRRKGGVN